MAKSKKTKTEKPVWLKLTGEEVKAIILKLADKGMTAEKIGLELRDRYGVPKVQLYGFRIKDILDEAGKFREPTLANLNAKLEKVIEHYSRNKQDKKAERSLIITKAKLKKREDYNNK
jgi:ribosomal protein S15P/S13E